MSLHPYSWPLACLRFLHEHRGDREQHPAPRRSESMETYRTMPPETIASLQTSFQNYALERKTSLAGGAVAAWQSELR